MIEQSINKLLKPEAFSLIQGEYVDIPRCNIIKYSPVSTVSDSDNNRAYAELPAIPLSLPLNMGVWQVNSSSAAFEPYIPINSQDWSVMGVSFSSGAQSGGINSSYLEQQIGFYVEGTRIYFTKDIKTQGIDNVDVHLLVSDLSQVGDNDLLPINPEIESSIIQDIIQSMGMGQISQAELNSKNENENR